MLSTDIVAWLGLTLSILVAIFDVYKYISDKPKLKISVVYDQQIMAHNGYGELTDQETGKTFWTVNVANVGNKPIIITHISFLRSDTDKTSILTKDYFGTISRYTLIPGDGHTYTIPDELIPPNKTREIHVCDATGNIFKSKL
jgi:hypothetical protein